MSNLSLFLLINVLTYTYTNLREWFVLFFLLITKAKSLQAGPCIFPRSPQASVKVGVLKKRTKKCAPARCSDEVFEGYKILLFEYRVEITRKSAYLRILIHRQREYLEVTKLLVKVI